MNFREVLVNMALGIRQTLPIQARCVHASGTPWNLPEWGKAGELTPCRKYYQMNSLNSLSANALWESIVIRSKLIRALHNATPRLPSIFSITN